MGIFRRGSKHTSSGPDPVLTASDGEAVGSAEGLDSDAAALTDHDVLSAPTASRDDGPFDRSEVAGLDGRLDLGALWLTGHPGLELRLEVEEESQTVVGVTAVLKDSAVQLQAFAAPRHEGIWDDIRTEIAASITSQGGTADKTSGPWGTELRAQMPDKGSDGRTVFSPVRFVGVDGPRWFLRAVLSGRAAADEEAATVLLDLVRATVVVRGDEAMAPRELLPLTLPEQLDEPDSDPSEPAGSEPAGQDTVGLDDFKPFERGPEITEIR